MDETKQSFPGVSIPRTARKNAKTAAGQQHSGFAAQRSRNWHSVVRGSSKGSERLASRVSRSPGIRVQRLSSLRHAALFQSARLIFEGLPQSPVIFTRRSSPNVERSLFLICKLLRNPQSIFQELKNCAAARCAKCSIWATHCCLSSQIGSPPLT